MPRLLVQISLSLDPDLLDHINSDIDGKNQSDKLRKCVTEGYKEIKKKLPEFEESK